jgi:hypothetical protein
MRVAWLAVVVGLLGAGLADAQPRRDGRADRRGVSDRREQIKKKIRALRAYMLTEELVLDEPTARRLFPTLARYDDETDRLVHKRVDVQLRLRRADALRDPRAIDRLIDEAMENQRAFWDLEARRIAELRKILTPVQVARVLVVLPALERRIQNQLRRAIVRQGDQTIDDSSDASDASDASDDDPLPDEVEAPPRRQRREAPLAPDATRGRRGERSNAPGNTPPCDPDAAPCR